MEIKQEISLSVSDLQAAYALYLKKTRSISIYWRIAILIVSGLLFWYDSNGDFLFIYIGICLIGLGIWNLYHVRNMGKRAVAAAPRYVWPNTFTITEETIHVINEYEDKTLKWKIFTDAMVTDQVLLLFIDKTMFYHFHKHHFTVEEYAWLSQKAAQFEKKKR